MTVTGAKRFQQAAIVKVSALRAGETRSKADLDAAAQRIFETGMFVGVNYRFDPIGPAKPGYRLTWLVEEAPATISVRLDVPGIDDQELWRDINSPDNLIRPQMPDSEPAAAYYRHAIEAALQKRSRIGDIVTRNEADLVTKRMTAVFRPANVPKISVIRFTGNRELDNAHLEATINRLATGTDYSEYDIHNLLNLNVRPLYEEKGYLTVAFPSVQLEESSGATPVAVMVGVEEGPAWNLGTVDLVGDNLPLKEMYKAAQFPLGKLANWKEVLAAINKAELVIKHDGYLSARSSPERSFQPDIHLVNLKISVNKDEQFSFGELQLSGLNTADQEQATRLWRLQAGTPMDGPYVDDYLRELLQKLKSPIKGVNSSLKTRQGTRVVDVAIVFKQ